MPLTTRSLPLTAATLLLLLATTAGAQPPPAASADAIEGVDKFQRVTTTIACGANTRPTAMPGLRDAGFRSVVSFREDGESGYDRAAMEAAAEAVGLRYVSIPVNRDAPAPAAAERFLAVIAAPDTAPAFLFCGSGERAAMMWLIKRVKQDGWTSERALAEAEGIGLSRPNLKQFALDYVGVATP
jgi:uncharacterized protein (TIGR01244 family)